MRPRRGRNGDGAAFAVACAPRPYARGLNTNRKRVCSERQVRHTRSPSSYETWKEPAPLAEQHFQQKGALGQEARVGFWGVDPQPQSSSRALPCPVLVSVDSYGSLCASRKCPQGTRSPPSPKWELRAKEEWRQQTLIPLGRSPKTRGAGGTQSPCWGLGQSPSVPLFR